MDFDVFTVALLLTGPMGNDHPQANPIPSRTHTSPTRRRLRVSGELLAAGPCTFDDRPEVRGRSCSGSTGRARGPIWRPIPPSPPGGSAPSWPRGGSPPRCWCPAWHPAQLDRRGSRRGAPAGATQPRRRARRTSAVTRAAPNGSSRAMLASASAALLRARGSCTADQRRSSLRCRIASANKPCSLASLTRQRPFSCSTMSLESRRRSISARAQQCRFAQRQHQAGVFRHVVGRIPSRGLRPRWPSRRARRHPGGRRR